MVVHVLVGVQLILDLLEGQIAGEAMSSGHWIIQVVIRQHIRELGLVLTHPMRLIENTPKADKKDHNPAHFGQTRKPPRHFSAPLVRRHWRIIGPRGTMRNVRSRQDRSGNGLFLNRNI